MISTAPTCMWLVSDSFVRNEASSAASLSIWPCAIAPTLPAGGRFHRYSITTDHHHPAAADQGLDPVAGEFRSGAELLHRGKDISGVGHGRVRLGSGYPVGGSYGLLREHPRGPEAGPARGAARLLRGRRPRRADGRARARSP